MNKYLQIGIVSAIVVMLGVGVWWGVEQNKNTKTTVKNTNGQVVANMNVTNTNSVIRISDTSEWKIQQISEIGIIFEMPSTWVVRKGKSESGFFGSVNTTQQFFIEDPISPFEDFGYYDSCNFSEFSNSGQLSLENWIKGSEIYVSGGEGVNIAKQERTTTNGIDGILVNETGPNVTTATSFYFSRTDSVVRYGYFEGIDISDQEVLRKYIEVCKKILESLKRT